MSMQPPPPESSPRIQLINSVLRLFFHLLYHQFAWTYDLVALSVSLGMWNRWIKAILPSIQGGPVLELGHGPGHIQLALNKAGILCFGLDQSPQMGRQAHRRLLRKQCLPHLINGLSQHLPFPTDHFQRVIATFPSEYIFDPLTLSEIYRVLVPGGNATILPLAWIMGSRPLEQLAAWLFRVTGEAPSWNDQFLDPARKAGFQTSSYKVVLPSSTLLFIQLTKPDHSFKQHLSLG
jgi:ubiquinone/menaquinone biosynthesis C-methylase UbiE